MIETIDSSLFRSRFEDYKRVGEKGNFSYKGLDLLFEYLEELEDPSQPIELDVVALCCEFSEYSSEELFKEYADANETSEELEERLMNEGKIVKQSGDLFILSD